jgi:hypothetical protein
MMDDSCTGKTETGASTPPAEPDRTLEIDILEHLLRQETLRQIEAAWKAERRIVKACYRVRSYKEGQAASGKVSKAEVSAPPNSGP